MSSVLTRNVKRSTEIVVGLTWTLQFLSIIFAPPARADAGVGMLMVMSVPMWAILLLLIIPLEAKIAQKVFELPFMTSLKISALANLASTVAGILITCASLLCYQMFWYNNPNTFWIVPVNELLWCVPCFYVSVWIEAMVAGKLVQSQLQKSVHQWAKKANVASYSILAALLLGLLIWSVTANLLERNSDDFCDVDRISAKRVWQAQYNHMRDGTGHYRKRKTHGYQRQNSDKPSSWLKEEYIKSYNAYDPVSDDKEIAILQAAMTQYDHAAASLTQSTPKDDLHLALSALADCYDRQKRFTEAIDARLRCLKLEYDNVTDLRLADDYTQLQEFNSASTIYEKLARLDDLYCHGNALIGLGNVAEKRKNFPLAEDYFRKAQQLFFANGGRAWFEYDEACVQLANCYIADKHYADAESLMLTETKLRDGNIQKDPQYTWPMPKFLFVLSDCYYAQGNYPKAERCIKQAMRGLSSLAEATKKYAEFSQKRGLTAEASTWRQRAKDAAVVQETVE